MGSRITGTEYARGWQAF